MSALDRVSDSSRTSPEVRVVPIAEIQKWQRSPLVQCPCDLFHQFGLGIGFLKYSCFAEILESLAIAVAGDEDDRQGGTCGVDRFRELDAGHLRHGKICKHEIDLQSACNQPKRFPSTCGWNRSVSERVEHSEGGPEDCLVV